MMRHIRHFLSRPVVLSFTHGTMLTAMLVLFVNANYEDGLYDQIVTKTINPGMSAQEKVVSLSNVTHNLLKNRSSLFGGQTNINLRDSLFRSSDLQLIDARQVCGSYAHVLARLLQRANFDIRLAQMKCKDVPDCHIVVEAKVDGKYVVVDPLYNLVFKKPDATLANFTEVGKNWNYYKKQLPENYDMNFAYQDVRYTNWEKIPIVMPAIKEVIRSFIGEEVNVLSIRPGVLNLYNIYGIITLKGYLILVIISFLVWRSRNKSKNLPYQNVVPQRYYATLRDRK